MFWVGEVLINKLNNKRAKVIEAIYKRNEKPLITVEMIDENKIVYITIFPEEWKDGE